ncbi:MAG TPA: Fe-Mn family superoxide dismutase [Patescibacteria group bacterium]|nr:Fe-Mn family superoxide dismutase [Patescibacteria group bacterium]
MSYQPQNFDHLLGTAGFSDDLLKNHFTLYQGYVTNVQKLSDELRVLTDGGKIGTPEYNELKRRFGWEFNGMRLHELYFENMQKEEKTLDEMPTLQMNLEKNFGSFAAWQKDFKAVGSMRGIGWAILSEDPATEQLFNVWIDEHDTGHLAGSTPLLVLDVFEHAYLTDYGIKRADYLETFFRVIDWKIVEDRFKKRG